MAKKARRTGTEILELLSQLPPERLLVFAALVIFFEHKLIVKPVDETEFLTACNELADHYKKHLSAHDLDFVKKVCAIRGA